MFVEIGLEGEGFAAALARERLQIGMSLNVGAQVRLVREGLVADLTPERLLTCARNRRQRKRNGQSIINRNRVHLVRRSARPTVRTRVLQWDWLPSRPSPPCKTLDEAYTKDTNSRTGLVSIKSESIL